MTLGAVGLRRSRARAAAYSLVVTSAAIVSMMVPLMLVAWWAHAPQQLGKELVGIVLAPLLWVATTIGVLFLVRCTWGVPTSEWRVGLEVAGAGLLIVVLRQYVTARFGFPMTTLALGRQVTPLLFTLALVPVPVVTAVSEAWLARRLRREQELRREAARALELEERLVRERLFDELHGTLQVGLVLAAIRAARIAEEPDSARARTEAARLHEELERLRVEDVRGLAHSLQPPLIEAGLVPSLRSLVGRSQELGNPVVLADIEEATLASATALDRGARLALYRLAEEGLSNALRHAPGAAIVVALESDGGALRLSVHDDGSPVPTNDGDGLGIRVLEARLQAYDGRLSLSRGARGTTLSGSVPCVAAMDAGGRASGRR